MLGVGGTGYSVLVEAPVPKKKKKKVPQDRYRITMCGMRAKSRVTVTVARPLGWGTGIRSTDTVSRARGGRWRACGGLEVVSWLLLAIFRLLALPTVLLIGCCLDALAE